MFKSPRKSNEKNEDFKNFKFWIGVKIVCFQAKLYIEKVSWGSLGCKIMSVMEITFSVVSHRKNFKLKFPVEKGE